MSLACLQMSGSHTHTHTQLQWRDSLWIGMSWFLFHRSNTIVHISCFFLPYMHQYGPFVHRCFLHAPRCVCFYVSIMACLFICRLTLVRPLLLISGAASFFRSPPSWLVMKTLLSERVLCLKASNVRRCDFTGGHREAYPISQGGTDH